MCSNGWLRTGPIYCPELQQHLQKLWNYGNALRDDGMLSPRYFGGDAASWMNLQVAYDLKQAELAEGNQIRTEVNPRAA